MSGFQANMCLNVSTVSLHNLVQTGFEVGTYTRVQRVSYFLKKTQAVICPSQNHPHARETTRTLPVRQHNQRWYRSPRVPVPGQRPVLLDERGAGPATRDGRDL